MKEKKVDVKRLKNFEKLPPEERVIALSRLDRMDALLKELDLSDLEIKLPKDVFNAIAGLAHDSTPSHAG